MYFGAGELIFFNPGSIIAIGLKPVPVIEKRIKPPDATGGHYTYHSRARHIFHRIVAAGAVLLENVTGFIRFSVIFIARCYHRRCSMGLISTSSQQQCTEEDILMGEKHTNG
jgi:hypothetical protein